MSATDGDLTISPTWTETTWVLAEVWAPTLALRWRQPCTGIGAKAPVLQQAWQSQRTGAVDWRDVPTEP